MSAESRLSEAYFCPKCRNRNCVVHHVTLPTGILPLPFGRYLSTTCSLCGYTEFYDRAVFEHLPEVEAEKGRATNAETASPDEAN
jgi:predicted nucleic-acid-binding Zn-ribbon protein